MAIPARGAPALGLKADNARFAKKYPKKPSVPKTVKVAPVDPNKLATDNAMSAFRTALAQLQASTPQVDANAIRAPYQAASVATGQLGQGLQTAVQGVGQAAQNQYAAGRDVAQQHAAQFGISAGAGANPTALTDTGTGALAAQTQAYATAAPQAATAWQQLLERSAGAKVADAELARTQGLTTAQQALSGSIPGAIANEKDLAFKQKTEKFNEGLALSQLDAKQGAELHDYILGKLKVKTSAAADKTNAQLKRDALNQKTSNDAANLRVKQDKLALDRRTKAATASGLKGIAAATKALSGTTSRAGTKKVAKGWDVQVVAVDPDNPDEVGTEVKTIHVPDKRYAPKGYQLVKGASASTHYETVPTSAGSAGLTASAWDAQMRSLLAQNPGRGAEIKRFLGPRPKK